MSTVIREAVIENYLVRMVRAHGGRADKYKTPGRRHSPDRIVLSYNERTAFCEVKRPGEKPRPGQLREHARLRALGFIVGVVDGHDDVDDFLHELIEAGFFGRRGDV